jgi:N-acetylglucosaminyl-diphospho-decaprenol L-rhamnosyltransferase
VSSESAAVGTRATALYVAYRTTAIDLAWIAEDADLIVVHNDESLDWRRCEHPRIRHLHTGRNLGFGAGVNAALPLVQTERLVICNPDTQLRREHWTALTQGAPDELISVALVDGEGCPTSIVNRYPTPISLLLMGYRVGRVLSRESSLRRRLEPLLGRWGTAHAQLREVRSGSWPLGDHWLSGALFSVDTERLRSVGGFDPGYFLYVEDIDLSARLAARFPEMRIRMVGADPGVHGVGGSATGHDESAAVDRHRLASVRRYGRTRPGLEWRLTDAALAPLSALLSRRGVTLP